MVTSASAFSSSRCPPPLVRPSSFEDRQTLLRFAASFLWADLEVAESEQRFLAALAAEIHPDIDEDDLEELILRPPAPEEVDPSAVPPALADAIRVVALRAIAADGRVDRREMELYELLDELLPPPTRTVRRPSTDGAES